MDEREQIELEAAVFRRLVEHLQKRTDVQNIDLMTTAGFCRNCLGDWYRDAAAERGLEIGKDDARARVYGKPNGRSGIRRRPQRNNSKLSSDRKRLTAKNERARWR